MRKIVLFLGVVLSTFGMAGSGVAGDTIKVGFVDTYTGPATTFTNDVLDGFKMAAEKINAKGGVLGKKITYVTRDDKFKPDIGLTMAKELILKENVDLLVGTIIIRALISCYEIPSTALAAELTSDYDERTSFLSLRERQRVLEGDREEDRLAPATPRFGDSVVNG